MLLRGTDCRDCEIRRRHNRRGLSLAPGYGRDPAHIIIRKAVQPLFTSCGQSQQVLCSLPAWCCQAGPTSRPFALIQNSAGFSFIAWRCWGCSATPCRVPERSGPLRQEEGGSCNEVL